MYLLFHCTCKELTMGKWKHGLSNTPTYYTWSGMLSRCFNPKAKSYSRYGGRGITVCERWRSSFANFVSDMGIRPDGCTIDRNDNDGDYCPENCRWATNPEQQRNKCGTRMIVFEGRSQPLAELAHRFGLPVGVVHYRIKSGWSTESALTTPVLKNWKRRGGRPKKIRDQPSQEAVVVEPSSPEC